MFRFVIPVFCALAVLLMTCRSPVSGAPASQAANNKKADASKTEPVVNGLSDQDNLRFINMADMMMDMAGILYKVQDESMAKAVSLQLELKISRLVSVLEKKSLIGQKSYQYEVLEELGWQITQQVQRIQNKPQLNEALEAQTLKLQKELQAVGLWRDKKPQRNVNFGTRLTETQSRLLYRKLSKLMKDAVAYFESVSVSNRRISDQQVSRILGHVDRVQNELGKMKQVDIKHRKKLEGLYGTALVAIERKLQAEVRRLKPHLSTDGVRQSIEKFMESLASDLQTHGVVSGPKHMVKRQPEVVYNAVLKYMNRTVLLAHSAKDRDSAWLWAPEVWVVIGKLQDLGPDRAGISIRMYRRFNRISAKQVGPIHQNLDGHMRRFLKDQRMGQHMLLPIIRLAPVLRTLDLSDDNEATAAPGSEAKPVPKPIAKPKIKVYWSVPSEWAEAKVNRLNPIAKHCQVIRQKQAGKFQVTIGVGIGPEATDPKDPAYKQYKDKIKKDLDRSLQNNKRTSIAKRWVIKDVKYDQLSVDLGKMTAMVQMNVQDGRCISYWFVGPKGQIREFMKLVGTAEIK